VVVVVLVVGYLLTVKQIMGYDDRLELGSRMLTTTTSSNSSGSNNSSNSSNSNCTAESTNCSAS